MKTVFAIGFLLALAGLAQAAGNLSEAVEKLPASKVCVGYQTEKGMLWVANVEVIGVHCDSAVSIVVDRAGYSVSVTVPTRFDSGNERRDEHVAELLGDDVRFEAHLPQQWLVTPPTEYEMPGLLLVSGKQIPVNLHVRPDNRGGYVFTVPTRFSTLGVKVPNVGPGGAIARPRDELVLFGRVPADFVNSFERKE